MHSVYAEAVGGGAGDEEYVVVLEFPRKLRMMLRKQVGRTSQSGQKERTEQSSELNDSHEDRKDAKDHHPIASE